MFYGVISTPYYATIPAGQQRNLASKLCEFSIILRVIRVIPPQGYQGYQGYYQSGQTLHSLFHGTFLQKPRNSLTEQFNVPLKKKKNLTRFNSLQNNVKIIFALVYPIPILLYYRDTCTQSFSPSWTWKIFPKNLFLETVTETFLLT